MKEILIISGKGGTGKTSITASLASLAQDIVICDLDVDAPDMHLLLQPKKLEHHEFWSGYVAFINESECSNCGICKENCRFDAVEEIAGHTTINAFNCEGCKLCVDLCSSKAIGFKLKHSGDWYLSQTRLGKMIHANLFPAEENSGKLISLLRKKAKELNKVENYQYMLCDGAPGIGCPVISSLSGTDLAVLVTEPTPSGVHDLARIIDLCNCFKVPSLSVINKCNINKDQCRKIKQLCAKKNVEVVGEIPFSKIFIRAVVKGKTIIEVSDYKLKIIFKEIWEKISLILKKD